MYAVLLGPDVRDSMEEMCVEIWDMFLKINVEKCCSLRFKISQNLNQEKEMMSSLIDAGRETKDYTYQRHTYHIFNNQMFDLSLYICYYSYSLNMLCGNAVSISNLELKKYIFRVRVSYFWENFFFIPYSSWVEKFYWFFFITL